MQNNEVAPISGILLVDKPSDWSSHDIINVARRSMGIRKIGHAGTLDPMATGLLILLVSRTATKLQNKFLKLSKTYEGIAELGSETDTWDAYGGITNTCEVPEFDLPTIHKHAKKLTGSFEHIVPLYSAKKVNGRPMHRYMREGRIVEERKALITVHEWEEISYSKPNIKFTVNVSSGTYVRSLAYMLGRELGCGGHLTRLRRTRVGDFDIKNAITVEELRSLPQEELYKRVMPLN
ncbi:tRNA pseudouridine synthase [Elusimicrobium minutum Pei191]|uniref:tRNA pseudouridine synthase B n=1 Tax=Elusimicrobium minutum (strain Pei191) TaxID=445932 RepID=B2KCA4_ELUMP|nr:tRNA pseudouridine(55) synthase TruB [Elusimicrobium minutum]ACC98231.1 tRNA pseudouridine synthase [Elusimicrobium minutum Pei191]